MSDAGEDIAVVVLAAGRGSRMGAAIAKPLVPVAGRPMLAHVLDTAERLAGARVVVVTAPGAAEVAACAAHHAVVEQPRRDGTAGAVAAARPSLETADAVIVLFGDCPLITAATLARMVAAWRAPPRADVVLLVYRQAGHWTDSGFMMVDTCRLWNWLDRLPTDDKGERSLNSVPPLAEAEGARIVRVPCAVEELLGANTPEELAEVERIHATRRASRTRRRAR